MSALAEAKPLRRRRRMLLGWSVFLGLSLAFPVASPAVGLYSPAFSVEPALPSTYEPTTLVMEGISPDACVPKLSGMSRVGNDLTVTLYRHDPLVACATVLTDWSDSADLGLLGDGDYSVTIHLRQFPPPFPSSFEVFGPVLFSILDRVGSTSHGITTIRTACRNQRTGEKVVVPGSASVANCEAAGLAVAPGDRIVVRTVGQVP